MHACMHVGFGCSSIGRMIEPLMARGHGGDPAGHPKPSDFPHSRIMEAQARPHAAEPPQHPAPIALQISNGNWECAHARCQISVEQTRLVYQVGQYKYTSIYISITIWTVLKKPFIT